MNVNDVIKGIDCCSEFMCGGCPYKIYESKDYPLKCIHNLMEDIKKCKDTDASYISKAREKEIKLALMLLTKAILRVTVNTYVEQGHEGAKEVIDILAQVEELCGVGGNDGKEEP